MNDNSKKEIVEKEYISQLKSKFSIYTKYKLLYKLYLYIFLSRRFKMSSQITNPVAVKVQALNKWHKEKLQLCTDWINDEVNQRSRSIMQKGVYLCKIGENIGGEINSEAGRDRPVLVISNNRVNKGSNVVIVPLTKRLKTTMIKGKQVPKYKTHYFLFQSKYSFLTYDSAVKTEDIRTVSKIRLTKKLGEIDEEDFNRIIKKISWMIGTKI